MTIPADSFLDIAVSTLRLDSSCLGQNFSDNRFVVFLLHLSGDRLDDGKSSGPGSRSNGTECRGHYHSG